MGGAGPAYRAVRAASVQESHAGGTIQTPFEFTWEVT